MKTSNHELFLKTYKTILLEQRLKSPEIYAWPLIELDAVFKRMALAIERGSFNKDSKTFKLTCKALKIKHTYRDIENFLGQE